MRILTVSDLHIGKLDWNRYGEIVLERLERHSDEADVLVIGGDIIDPTGDRATNERRLRDALVRIGHSRIRNKVAVVGNNDIDCFDGPIAEYVERMAPWYADAGIHLLDAASTEIEGILFAGTLGWCNGELYRGNPFPEERVAAYWHESKRYHGRQGNLGPFDLHAQCMNRLRSQIPAAAGRIVVITHEVPTSDLVQYGNSEMDDYLNTFMGFDGARYPDVYDPSRVVLSLVGHTHRNEGAVLNKIPIVNMSGGKQPRSIVI